MSSIKLTGDTSGEITISAPAVAGTNTLTLPSSTGEITVGGNNTPLCRVALGSDQTGVGDAVNTKLEFSTVTFEQGMTFDTTNHRFTVPSGAEGYYQVNVQVSCRTETNSDLRSAIAYVAKNGVAYGASNEQNFLLNDVRVSTITLAKIISLQTAGDYIEVYGYINTVAAGSSRSFTNSRTEMTIHKLIS